jgi:hypothetical protein
VENARPALAMGVHGSSGFSVAHAAIMFVLFFRAGLVIIGACAKTSLSVSRNGKVCSMTVFGKYGHQKSFPLPKVGA